MGEPVISDAILVLNAGSSSIKFAVFDGELEERLSGIAEAIGGASRLKVGKVTDDTPLIDHRAALKAILAALADHGITLLSLCTWWDVIAAAREGSTFDAATLDAVEAYLRNPGGWTPQG